MKRANSQPVLKLCEEPDRDEAGHSYGSNGKIPASAGNDSDCIIDGVVGQFKRMSFHTVEPLKRGEQLSLEKYGVWRNGQKSSAARLEKHLRSRWTMEDLIDEQLCRFHAHFNRAMAPTRMKDVAQLLMPKWAPARELATQTWLGDWRPSAILELLRSLVNPSSPFSSYLTDSVGTEGVLSRLIHEIRIEEAVIDEEMAEIQATCILHLPFGPRQNPDDGPPLKSMQSEFKKIHRVITKAQKLRFKVMEMVVKKVLNLTDAAEFLVAFSGIQDLIHQVSTHHKLRKGPISLPPAKTSISS